MVTIYKRPMWVSEEMPAYCSDFSYFYENEKGEIIHVPSLADVPDPKKKDYVSVSEAPSVCMSFHNRESGMERVAIAALEYAITTYGKEYEFLVSRKMLEYSTPYGAGSNNARLLRWHHNWEETEIVPIKVKALEMIAPPPMENDSPDPLECDRLDREYIFFKKDLKDKDGI